MKQFKGRPIVAGECTAEALVSHGGFNTLASFQSALQFGDLLGDKETKCGDQNNADIYGKVWAVRLFAFPRQSAQQQAVWFSTAQPL